MAETMAVLADRPSALDRGDCPFDWMPLIRGHFCLWMLARLAVDLVPLINNNCY